MIGGSLALALRERRPDLSLRLWARSERSAAAAREVFPDVVVDAREAAMGATLCILCTPVSAMAGLAREIAPVLAAGAVVTDAGSTKATAVREVEAVLGGRFVGSHPMAGSERNGIGAARANLFEGAVAVVTPTESSAADAVEAVRELWRTVGSRLVEMSPEEHDESIGRVSHVPHAVAAALVNAIQARLPGAIAFAGGGYRDTTRIAGGPARMWSEILVENRASVLTGLDDLTESIEQLKNLLLQADPSAVESFLDRARKVRETLP